MTFRREEHLKKAGALIEHHAKDLLSYTYSRLHDRQLAEDIVWDVFERICEKPDICQSIQEPAWPYLVGAVNNGIANAIRKERNKKHTQQEFLDRHQEKWESSPEEARLPGELREQLSELIRNLPEKQREVFDLFREGLNTQEIADQLDLAPQTVLNHKNLAIRALREEAVRLGLKWLFLWLLWLR